MGDSSHKRRYDRWVINLHQLDAGVFTGLALIFIRFAPVVFQAIIDGMIRRVDRLVGRTSLQIVPTDEFPRPKWLAPLGVGIIAASFIVYFVR